ncbi:hypothetical protein [Oribacterium sp. WCC10]|uniref:hypothetical protein n=1 Tax=Oribacterium sp. WCC10 TaxID=1855343 RepID=UPI0008EE3EF8|nr:hypothetical protein [Oribacterium sp. WCC10]SFG68780.1 hypothetical protein SAMN05216356_11928 [Oribacterium sp. WCC10]
MDIIIMNGILTLAIVSIGYYILEAFISLFMYQSTPLERAKRRRNMLKAFSVINGTTRKRKSGHQLKRVVNS